MNFMQWLSSLDELLYEVMSWIVFFPVTLWRTIRRPIAMMDYADRQLQLPEDAQYAETMSPPLFLALSLLIAHIAELSLGRANAIVTSRKGLAAFIDDDTSLLLMRLILFSIFPLIMAVLLVRRRGIPLDRTTLKLPFYAQCYPAAAFALAIGTGTVMLQFEPVYLRGAGTILTVGAIIFYLIVQTRWFARQTGSGMGRALVTASLGLLGGFAALVAAGVLFGLSA
jgi:hypothetical protein